MKKVNGKRVAEEVAVSPDLSGLLDGLLDIHRAGGVLEEVLLTQPSERSADAGIQFNLNGQSYRYDLAVKTEILRTVQLMQVIREFGARSTPLLVTLHMSAGMAKSCVKNGIQFLDLAGNMHLRGPSLYVLVEGKTLSDDARQIASSLETSTASATASSLRIIFSLLTTPRLVEASHREIAAQAGVAHGAVSPVLADLQRRGYLAAGATASKRRLLGTSSLEDEWITAYPLRLRKKLKSRRFTAQDPTWWKSVQLPPKQAWWSAEVAAAYITNDLRPETQTIYVSEDGRETVMREIIRAGKLKADPNGPIEILNSFWLPDAIPNNNALAPSLLVYADLLNSDDSRNIAVANEVRRADAGQRE